MLCSFTHPVYLRISVEILMYKCAEVFIFLFLGDLLPRHVQIFSTNSFFKGMIIPEPERLVSHLPFFRGAIELEKSGKLGFDFGVLRKCW